MGNFDINLLPEDATQLKTLAKDTSYRGWPAASTSMRPGRPRSAPARMAKGGDAVGGAFLAAGIGMGGMAASSRQRRRPHPRQDSRAAHPVATPARRPVVLPLPRPRCRRAGRRHRCVCQLRQPEPGRREVLRELRSAHRAEGGALHRVRHRVAAGAKFCMNCGTAQHLPRRAYSHSMVPGGLD